MVSDPANDPPRRPARLLALAVLLALATARPTTGQDDTRPPAVAERPTDAADAEANGKAKGDPSGASGVAEAERRHKTRLVEVAGLMLLVLLVIGVLLVAGVMLLGARARRLVRKPLPGQSAPDPLWYLRKKPRAPADPSRDEASGGQI